MNILILHGGARKKGNTVTITGWVEEELVSMGHGVETIFLFNKDIRCCLACMKCKQFPDEVGCVQKDDAAEILDKVAAADGVIFTSPLYFWGLAGPLKMLIDRTYSLYIDYHQPTHASLVEGQRQGLLVTGGGPFENNAEPVFTAFNNLQRPHKSVKAAELYVGGCKTPDNLPEGAKEKAVQFARDLVA